MIKLKDIKGTLYFNVRSIPDGNGGYKLMNCTPHNVTTKNFGVRNAMWEAWYSIDKSVAGKISPYGFSYVTGLTSHFGISSGTYTWAAWTYGSHNLQFCDAKCVTGTNAGRFTIKLTHTGRWGETGSPALLAQYNNNAPDYDIAPGRAREGWNHIMDIRTSKGHNLYLNGVKIMTSTLGMSSSLSAVYAMHTNGGPFDDVVFIKGQALDLGDKFDLDEAKYFIEDDFDYTDTMYPFFAIDDPYNKDWTSAENTISTEGEIKAAEVETAPYVLRATNNQRLANYDTATDKIEEVKDETTGETTTKTTIEPSNLTYSIIDPVMEKRITLKSNGTTDAKSSYMQLPNTRMANTITLTDKRNFSDWLTSKFTIGLWLNMPAKNKFKFAIMDLFVSDVFWITDSDLISDYISVDKKVTGNKNVTNSITITDMFDKWNYWLITYDQGKMITYFNGKKVMYANHQFSQQHYNSKFYIELGGKNAKLQDVTVIKDQIVYKDEFTPPTGFLVSSATVSADKISYLKIGNK